MKSQTEKSIRAIVQIEIPKTHVLVEVDEYNRLLESDYFGKTGDLEWFKSVTNISGVTAYKKLIAFKNELSDFVYFPPSKGSRWLFKKTEMLQWLEKNWKRWVNK